MGHVLSDNEEHERVTKLAANK